MSCEFICVKPIRGVVSMPDRDNRCMPVEGIKVKNTPYYRKLIALGDIVFIDCETMEEVEQTEWRGTLKGSYSHEYKDAQVLSIANLLATSGEANEGVYEIDIDVKETNDGVRLVRAGGEDIIQPGGSRTWKGADDGLGNLTNATDFELTMKADDIVTISWSEISE